MPIPISVFSLADVLAKSDAAAMNRRQMQLADMKMQEYERNQQQQQTLGDIIGRSITTTGGSPAIPEQVMPEDVLGPPRPAVPEVQGRTDFDYNKMFAQAQNLAPNMRGPILQQLHAARAAEEDRRLAMQLKTMQAERGRGEYYTPVYDDKGRLLSFNNRLGQVTEPTMPVVGGKFSPNLQGRLEASKEHGKAVGKESADAGRSADAVSNIADAVAILDKGIYSGSLAEYKKNIAKITPGMDKRKAANTEEFISYIGNVVIPRMKELGGSDTDEELRYMRMITGGEISMEPKALRNILLSADRKIKARQSRLVRQSGQVGLGEKVESAIRREPTFKGMTDDEYNRKLQEANR